MFGTLIVGGIIGGLVVAFFRDHPTVVKVHEKLRSLVS